MARLRTAVFTAFVWYRFGLFVALPVMMHPIMHHTARWRNENNWIMLDISIDMLQLSF
jgi:hypothetical protein